MVWLKEAFRKRLAGAWRGRRQAPPAAQTATTEERPFASFEIPEITPQHGRTCATPGLRFNLLLPTVRAAHVFGGIGTALQFFNRLIGDDRDARVVLTDDSHASGPLPATLEGWQPRSAAAEDIAGRIVVPFGVRADATLPVRRRDVFVATAWWTAYTTQRLLAWQAEAHSMERLPLIYLLQDHEPGFHPPSSRYSLARSTYEYAGPVIGVFNTGLLRDYFAQQGYAFTQCYTFEPQLNPALARARQQYANFRKERRIIVYGRPSVPRNGFELVCLGLRRWIASDATAGQWRIESVGELHQDIALEHGAIIVSRGKLSLEEYAHTLASAAIGVSLMFSPHPSYPPLEMAEYGVQVITNRYANKNLGIRSPLIYSLDSLTPESIAAALASLTAPWRNLGQRDQLVPVPPGSLFVDAEEAFSFVPQLRGSLEHRS